MSADQEHEDTPSNPDIHFEPIVTLAKVDVKTLEENEEEMIKMRAKLFRYIIGQHDSTAEWKERGIGDVKILKNKSKHTYRLVMRREKTFKVCANHFISKDMELKPNCGSDRAWVWTVPADFADEEPQKETLAIRFANAENANKFKEVFDKCKEKLGGGTGDVESEKLASELESLKVKDEGESTGTEQTEKCNGQEEGEIQEDETTTDETKTDEETKTQDETETQDETKTEAGTKTENDTPQQKDDTEKETDTDKPSNNDKPCETAKDPSTQESEGP